MELVLPSLKYKESYLDALKESENDVNSNGVTFQRPKENESFEDFVKHESIISLQPDQRFKLYIKTHCNIYE